MAHRNLTLANEALESEQAIDDFRDRIFEALLSSIKQDPSLAAPSMQYMLATRDLERIADRAADIAEDIVFWLRGLDIRHNRANSFGIGGGEASAEGM